LFAPRDKEEVDVIMEIVFQSYLYAKGEKKVSISFNWAESRNYDKDHFDAVLETLSIGKMGRYTNWQGQVCKFEQEVSVYLKVEYALMVGSGTAALSCALLGLGIGPGDEVLVSAYTWISTTAAIINVGAVPVIVDIDDSFGMDPQDAMKKKTIYTKGMIVTHMRGVPCRINKLQHFAKENNIHLIEDCCQCVGGKYKNKHVGTYGEVGCWSLNHFKNLCVGEGGVVFTNSREVYERSWSTIEPGFQKPTELQSMRNFPDVKQSFSKWSTPHFVWTSSRASELNGTLGRVGLNKLDKDLQRCRELKSTFKGNLAPAKGYKFQHCKEGDCGTNCSIIITDGNLVDKYVNALRAEQIPVRKLFDKNIHECSVYYHWDSILAKQSPHSTGYPWKDPAYKGNVSYSKEMCPVALELLSKAITFEFPISGRTTITDAIFMANALNKVDKFIMALDVPKKEL